MNRGADHLARMFGGIYALVFQMKCHDGLTRPLCREYWQWNSEFWKCWHDLWLFGMFACNTNHGTHDNSK